MPTRHEEVIVSSHKRPEVEYERRDYKNVEYKPSHYTEGTVVRREYVDASGKIYKTESLVDGTLKSTDTWTPNIRSHSRVDNFVRQDVMANPTTVGQPIRIEEQVKNTYTQPQTIVMSSNQVPIQSGQITRIPQQQYNETVIRSSHVTSQSPVPVRTSSVMRSEGFVSNQPIRTEGYVSTQPVIRTEGFSNQVYTNQGVISNQPVIRNEGLISTNQVIRNEGYVSNQPVIRTEGLVSTGNVVRTGPVYSNLNTNTTTTEGFVTSGNVGNVVRNEGNIIRYDGAINSGNVVRTNTIDNQINQGVTYQNYGFGENVVRSDAMVNTGPKVVSTNYYPTTNFVTNQPNYLSNMPVTNTNMVNQEVIENRVESGAQNFEVNTRNEEL